MEGHMAAPRKRDAMGWGLSALTRLAGSKVVDRVGLRKPIENLVTAGTRNGFRVAGAATRSFKSVQKLGKPARLAPAADTGQFDLTPSEDQQLIVETVTEFAAEQLRPAAADADAKLEAPEGLLTRAAELGISLVGIPEELGGVGTERSVVTNALVAEALAHGDLGLAVAVLAPSAVSTALVSWGDEQQQADYLPAFVAATPPPPPRRSWRKRPRRGAGAAGAESALRPLQAGDEGAPHPEGLPARRREVAG